MSDLDPQTRDLRDALRPTEPGARKETRNVPPLVWIVLVVLVALVVVAWLGWGKTLRTPAGHDVPAASSTAATPPSGG